MSFSVRPKDRDTQETRELQAGKKSLGFESPGQVQSIDATIAS